MKTKLIKLEHSSILLQHKGKRILFDPGNFSIQNEKLHDIDILIITHKHGDHFNIENVKYINEHAVNLQIITNSEVAKAINEFEINTQVAEGNDSITIGDINITAHDHPHEEIFGEFGLAQNTGYYIDDAFFHPGDAFTKPNKSVKAVTTVIIAPFMRVKMAIDYINDNPNMIHIGVHDSVANPDFLGWLKNIIEKNVNADSIYKHSDSEPITL